MDNQVQTEPSVTPIPITSSPRKRKSANRFKSFIIWGEFFLIILLIAAITVTTFLHRKQLNESMLKMSSEQKVLSDELAQLADSVERMEKL